MNNLNKQPQQYRAVVGAFFINNKNEILLTQNVSFKDNYWTIVKGGMHFGEEENETLERELLEELGNEFQYKVLRRSTTNLIYAWPTEKQQKTGFRGNAVSCYWVLLTRGKISPTKDEIKAAKWVPITKLKGFLLDSLWSEREVEPILDDWKRLCRQFHLIEKS